MGSATTGFNAPSREAIYKNVNMLTDDSFVYDYETFVAFDQKSTSNIEAISSNIPYNKPRMRRLPPPVFVDNGSTPHGGACTTVSK